MLVGVYGLTEDVELALPILRILVLRHSRFPIDLISSSGRVSGCLLLTYVLVAFTKISVIEISRTFIKFISIKVVLKSLLQNVRHLSITCVEESLI